MQNCLVRSRGTTSYFVTCALGIGAKENPKLSLLYVLILWAWDRSMYIHCINSVLYICLTRARNGACRCVGYCDYFKIRGHTLRLKLYKPKIPEKSMVLWVKFMVSSQWTTVQFLVRLIVFVVVVRAQWPTTRKAENINRWKKCEACGSCSWRRSLQHVKNFLEQCEFQQRQCSVFWLMI